MDKGEVHAVTADNINIVAKIMLLFKDLLSGIKDSRFLIESNTSFGRCAICMARQMIAYSYQHPTNGTDLVLAQYTDTLAR